MGLVDIYAAVKAEWNADSLSESITGGIHTGGKGATTLPRVEFSVLGSAADSRTRGGRRGAASGTTVIKTAVRFRLIGEDGLAATAELAELVRATFDNAELTMPVTTTDELLYCRFVNELPVQHPDPQYSHIWQFDMTYEILTSKAQPIGG